MSTPSAATPAVPLPAATVVVARACPDDTFEVFLVRRHGKSGFMAGAHVFPGGKIDEDDRRFGDEVDPFAIGAIRETFEETGVLLARPESGLPLSSTGPIEAVSARLTSGEPFSHALGRAGLLPDLAALIPIAWWITPAQEPRRFDTRFFFALVPAVQRHRAMADGVEVEDGVWLSPLAALERYRDGALRLAPPTLVTLEELAELPLSRVARHPWPLAPVEPAITEVDGRLVLALPGDPLHPVKTPVWPHRTRIVTDDDGHFASARP